MIRIRLAVNMTASTTGDMCHGFVLFETPVFRSASTPSPRRYLLLFRFGEQMSESNYYFRTKLDRADGAALDIVISDLG